MISTGGGLLALLREAMPDMQTPALVAARDGIQGNTDVRRLSALNPRRPRRRSPSVGQFAAESDTSPTKNDPITIGSAAALLSFRTSSRLLGDGLSDSTGSLRLPAFLRSSFIEVASSVVKLTNKSTR